MVQVYKYVELMFRLPGLRPAVAFYGYVGGFDPDSWPASRATSEAKQQLLMARPDAQRISVCRIVEVTPDEAYHIQKSIDRGRWLPRPTASPQWAAGDSNPEHLD